MAFSLFGHPVYWYGVIIGCGFLLAVLLCCRWAPRFGVNSDQIMDLLIFAVPLSVVGLRVYYVLFYLDLYREADGSLNWGPSSASRTAAWPSTAASLPPP